MTLRSLARLLVVGAVAVFAVFLVSGIALAQDADETVVQGQNGSDDATATSGDVAGSNDVVATAGPSATSSGSNSQSMQNGNNSVTVNQSASAKSGDSVAGSQVVGVVGGDATIQNQNSSSGATATSGNATATNTAAVSAGPSATATGSTAQAAQDGDNSVVVDQHSEAETGDSLAGSTVVGAVGDAITVSNQNSSEDPFSISGDAIAANVAAVGVGPSAFAGGGPSDDALAMVSQTGDNDVTLTQSSFAATGDSLAGAQVVGAVGTDDISVTNQNSTEDPVAVGGDAFATNVAVVSAGPTANAFAGTGSATAQVSQSGDNEVAVEQESEALTGDTIAGGQVVGLVSSENGNLEAVNQQSSDDPIAIGGDAVSTNVAVVAAGPTAAAFANTGDVDAQATQNGDNEVDLVQIAIAESGDTLAGSAVVGAVGGDTASISGQNSAEDPVAIGGSATATNVAVLAVGPAAAATSGTGDANAMTSQNGDNEVDAVQVVEVQTGDALAGSQVTGAVGVDEVDVTNQNNSEDAVAISGDADGTNILTAAVGPDATATSGTGTTTAAAAQNGDNVLEFVQLAVVGSGDAVAGSQVAGLVGTDDGSVQQQNSSDDPFALSGSVGGLNSAAGFLGAAAASSNGNAATIQDGDTVLDGTQELELVSGDSVSGGQVVGSVGTTALSAAASREVERLTFGTAGVVAA